MEVIRLTSTSFRSVKLNESGSSEESGDACPPPSGVFIEMPSPHYLGPAPESGSSYFLTKDESDVLTVVQVIAPVVLGEILKEPILELRIWDLYNPIFGHFILFFPLIDTMFKQSLACNKFNIASFAYANRFLSRKQNKK